MYKMTGKKDDHVKIVCSAVLKVWNKRSHSHADLLQRPDTINRNSPDVDYLAGQGLPEIAIEHTRLESYSEQLADEDMFWKLMQPIREYFEQKKLPACGSYVLSIQCAAALVAKGHDKSVIHKEIIVWIEATAPTLKVGKPPTHYSEIKLKSAPIKVALYVFQAISEQKRGVLSFSRFVPEDLEKQRAIRIGKALDEKCPKLQQYKADGLRTVLILESNDLALSSFGSIADAFMKVAQIRLGLPDYIYVVESELGDPIVWVLKDGPNLANNIDDFGPYSESIRNRTIKVGKTN